MNEVREELKFFLEDKNSKTESLKQLEIVLDRRNGEIHSLKKEIHKLELNFKNLKNVLYTTEKERDHLAVLLDTAEFHHENSDSDDESKTSPTNSEDNLELTDSEFINQNLTNTEPSEKDSQPVVNLNINSKDNPKVIEIIKEHFLDIMKEYEEEKAQKDIQISELTKKIKTLYSKNITYANDGKENIDMLLEISSILKQIN